MWFSSTAHFLASIDVDGIVRSISLLRVSKHFRHQVCTHEEHGICDLVLTHTPAKYDHPRLFRMHAHIIQPANISDDVDVELRR